jgi:hypothetical protein
MKKIFLFSFFCLLAAATIQLHAQNVNISEGNDFDGEPFLCVNPENSLHLVVAWMCFDGIDLIEMRTRVSENGGITWGPVTEIPHEVFGNTSADPSLAFDSEGNVFLCYIDYNPFGTSGAVYVRKSVDGGYNWGEPVQVIDAFADGSEMPVDRPWMVIDRSGGINDGYIYITTKPAPWIPFPNRNYLIVSDDGGETFGDWQYIDAPGWNIGAFIQAPMASPVVSADGTFHCIYPAWNLADNILPRFIHAESSDGAETLNYHEVIESGGGELMTDTLPKLGYLLISQESDPVQLIFAFIIKPFGDADIFILESGDAGVSWSDYLRVNDDPIGSGVMQDMVWADTNAEGDLLVTWRDRRNAADTGYVAASEFWAAVKWKDSVHFSPNFKLSDELVVFHEVLKENGNDFMGCSFVGDTVYAVWGEARDSLLNIWFTKMSATTGTGTGIQEIGSERAETISVFPNPVSDFVTLDCDPGSRIEIYDQAGKIAKVITSSNSNQIDLRELPAGTYTIRIEPGVLKPVTVIKN